MTSLHLHTTFNRQAIRFCADTEACLAQEPLHVSRTGREAILAMLEGNVRLLRFGSQKIEPQ